MIVAGVLIAIAVLGGTLSALILRADSSRYDNRLFFAIGLLDAISAAARAAVVIDTGRLACPENAYVGTTSGILIGYASFEFAYSYPFNRRAPLALRIPVAVAALLSLAMLVHPSTHAWFEELSFVYFVPIFALTMALLWRNLERVRAGKQGRFAGIPLVMLAIALRWTFATVTFTIVERFAERWFEAFLYWETTGVVLLGYLLIGYAVLRHQLFRVRGVVAQMVILGGGAVSVLGLVALSIEAALRYVTGPMSQRLTLVAISLIPVAMIASAKLAKRRLGASRLLSGIDPRGAAVREELSRTLAALRAELTADGLFRVAIAALGRMVSGAEVTFARGPAAPAVDLAGEARALGPALSAHLEDPGVAHLLRGDAPGLEPSVASELSALGADLVVPVRRAGALFGAICVSGGRIDRGALEAAVEIAHQLALRLESYALFAERMKLSAQLEESRRLAALGAFAAAIAHDIRTPLTSVQMNVQILRGKTHLGADDMEYFDIALDELKRLNAQVAEILDYAKPVQLRAERVELRDVAEEAARKIAPIVAARSLRIERVHEPQMPHVKGDPDRLTQIALNLMDNAAQASADGEVIEITTSTAQDGRPALEVRDRGRGIAPENLSKIFEPFFTTRADGTGLGLATAQKLVRAHGGELRVQSEPGRGTTFTVLLPAANETLPVL